MQHLNERERISLLMMRGWGDRHRSYKEVALLFNETFRCGQIGISKSTVERTVRRFEETGNVKNRAKSGRPATATNPDKALDVLSSFVENPHSSIRDIAQENDIGLASVHKVLKKNKFHPYKVHLVQELSDDDFDRRLEFCDLMTDRITRDPQFSSNIVFSDEATFTLIGEVNRHNCRYWDNENPHWMVEAHSQHPQKLNVWAGLLGESVLGPFFIDGNLTAQKYENMLRDEIVPAIQTIAGPNFNDVWFQQDGAPAHYALQVRRCLDEFFPNRWIGRRGPIEWPPRSPDLAPLDYFFWGYLKSKVYITKPNDPDDLRRRIVDETRYIPQEYNRNAVSSFYNRLAQCQAVQGEHFEHLL